jgi:S-DNA-T family DNA segregation ATPase FtsK/SpoIIIE
METFLNNPGSKRTLRIRCDRATKRDLKGLNVDAGMYFALRYAGLQRLLGPDVVLDLGPLTEFSELVESWKQAKTKGVPNRSTAKAALQLKFQLDFEIESSTGSIQTASTQLVWRYEPNVISSQFVDDWSRLEAHPLTIGRTSREPAVAGRRAGAIDLRDVRTLVPAYDRDRGSLLPVYRKAQDIALFWPANLRRNVEEGYITDEAAAAITVAFETFSKAYIEAVQEFRTGGPGNAVNRSQATAYGDLLDLIVRLAPGDRNREALLRPFPQGRLQRGRGPTLAAHSAARFSRSANRADFLGNA